MNLFYHITSRRNLESIQKEGLLPQYGYLSELVMEQRSAIYLFKELDEVRYAMENWFGECIRYVYDKKEYLKYGLQNRKKLASYAKMLIEQFRIKSGDGKEAVKMLSGGNIQKVVVAREFTSGSNFILANQPTRGIDVGAKTEFYDIISNLAEQDVGVIMISSEESELIGLCDRIMVMRAGRKVGELLPREDPDIKEHLIRLMLNITESEEDASHSATG